MSRAPSGTLMLSSNLKLTLLVMLMTPSSFPILKPQLLRTRNTSKLSRMSMRKEVSVAKVTTTNGNPNRRARISSELTLLPCHLNTSNRLLSKNHSNPASSSQLIECSETKPWTTLIWLSSIRLKASSLIATWDSSI